MPHAASPASAFWTLAALARAAGGRWLTAPADPGLTAAGLGIDSRSLRPGEVFLALRGERFDGHDFLPQAAAAGAALLVVQDHAVPAAALPSGVAVLAVDDTLRALQALARGYRRALGASGTRVIAVTGSNGKTTTRHLIHHLLTSPAAGLAGTQSPKSFNNHIGVPLTLLAARLDDDFVVAEVGTNHPGEIAALADLLRPDAAVITHLGSAHLGHFGSRAAIAREKAALLAALAPDGLAVIPEPARWPEGTSPEACGLPAEANVVWIGGPSGRTAVDRIESRLDLIDLHEDHAGLHFTAAGQGSRLSIDLPLPGRHNAGNALGAIAVARWMGVSDAAIAAGLASLRGVPMRLECRTIGPTDRPLLLINDAYNANPDSMRAAIDHLRRCTPPAPTGRRIAILGDMRELGDAAAEEHRRLGAHLAEAGEAALPALDLALFIGEDSAAAAAELRRHWPAERARHFPRWEDDLPRRIAALIQPGDVVLLKASRGLALERLVPALEQCFSAPTTE